MITPSSSIIEPAAAGCVISDSGGRRITVRRLTALDKIRLFKAAGPTLSRNQPWLGMALLAFSVTAIDDVPIPAPTNEMQIEAIIARLGDSGVSAVAAQVSSFSEAQSADVVAIAGN